MKLPPEIFKAYDIRGVVGKSLTPEVVHAIGGALGTLAQERGRDTLVVGRDGRLSGPALAGALADGIRATGAHVIDVGAVTTPMTYFAAYELGTQCSVMVTGSHNPPDYNGLKMVVAGETLSGDDIQALRTRIEAGRLATGSGSYRTADIGQAYIERVGTGVRLARGLRVAIDAGNGIAGAYAPALFRRLGCKVTEMYCEVDGTFPNHHPDPSQPANLHDLIELVREGRHDIGLAFDGDGDRLGVVTADGHVIYPDRQLMLFASDVLSRVPGATIIYDVKSTRNLKPWITRHGGQPLLWKTGHSLIKGKMKDLGAPIAGEMSGHMFFTESFYGHDDAVYAAARLMRIVSEAGQRIEDLLADVPRFVSTPEIRIDCPDDRKFTIVDEAVRHFARDHEVVGVDGARVLFGEGWGLIRASNTQPVLVARFEARTAEQLTRIQTEMESWLRSQGVSP